MSFLDTVPAAISRLDGRGPWARFQVIHPQQRVSMLRELVRGDVPLTLGPADGATCRGVLWAFDEAAGLLRLRLAPGSEQALLFVPGAVWAAGYLHEAKLQFELLGLHGQAQAPDVLLAGMPERMVHLPRRRALRVRRPEGQGPTLHIAHLHEGDPPLSLAVADISMTGVGLWKPQLTPLLRPGTEISAVRVTLDPGVEIRADLQVAQLSPASRRGGGLRVGCEWRAMAPEAAETLQRWIARGSRRGGMVSLAFE